MCRMAPYTLTILPLHFSSTEFRAIFCPWLLAFVLLNGRPHRLADPSSKCPLGDHFEIPSRGEAAILVAADWTVRVDFGNHRACQNKEEMKECRDSTPQH